MDPLSENEINQYLEGDYSNTPKCEACAKKLCYIIVETKLEKSLSNNMGGIHFFSACSLPPPRETIKERRFYYYSTTCNTCKPKQTYITDASMNAFLKADCHYGPTCIQCHRAYCFIRIEEDGKKYFSKKCSSCIESKKI